MEEINLGGADGVEVKKEAGEEEEINLGVAGGVLVKKEAGEEEEIEFEPTEDELVLHFLRPQLRGFAPRVAGAVVEADPCAATPWELLARHGLLRSGHGYFFAARRRGEGAQARRTPEGGGGGKWMHSGSKEHRRSVTELGVVARWSMTLYCFYARGGVRGEDGAQQGRRRSTGWAMSEYEITDPRCYRRADDGEEEHYWVLCHVRRSVKKNLKPRSWECWKSWDLQQFSEHEKS
ncbi:NAC domain-containing protein 18-like [Triticum urartu]|uniref:NAC domain-containing protein 18-like n=1 Tax=Triticum urartu TaxID=4572 RepID=UPI0020435F54|nr:NAC domain-containing protein 18-like [Triticum urartu]